MRDQFVSNLLEEAIKNPRVVLLTGDLGFGLFDEFEKKVPNQYFNMGISEQNMIGVAAGLALDGYKVFCYSIGNFSFMRCLEQVRNDVCYHNLDVNIISSGPGFSYGALGFTHHTIEDIAILRSIPNISIYSPATEYETNLSFNKIIQDSNPTFCRLDKVNVETDRFRDIEYFEWGTLIGKNGSIILITTGTLLEEVLKTLDKLPNNISSKIKVISLCAIKDFDETQLLKIICESKLIFSIEEHVLNGGLGSLISEVLVDNRIRDIYLKRLGINNEFAKVVGSQSYLRNEFNLSSDSITNFISIEIKNLREEEWL